MGNGSHELPHVAFVKQRDDDTIVVQVQTNSFNPGQKVEVSVVLFQGNDYYVISSSIEQIPSPNDPNSPKQLPVELPATVLNAGQEVTVVTRVTEVWPTVLQPNSTESVQAVEGEILKAVWTYQEGQGSGT